MTKYLIKADYTAEGVKGLLKTGGTIRKQAIEDTVKKLGGQLDSFYYSFCEHDVYTVCALPDAATAAAVILSINASGLVSVSAEVLVDPEEIDKAKDISVNYRTPGN
ncbi:MAG: GYD domain-containing protein [Ginsengibacter sp.]